MFKLCYANYNTEIFVNREFDGPGREFYVYRDCWPYKGDIRIYLHECKYYTVDTEREGYAESTIYWVTFYREVTHYQPGPITVAFTRADFDMYFSIDEELSKTISDKELES